MLDVLTRGHARRPRRYGRARRGARDGRRDGSRASRRAGTCSTSLGVRAVQARILALRGEGAQVAEMLDWLESVAPGRPGTRRLRLLGLRLGRPGARRARAGRGRRGAARRDRGLPRRPRQPELPDLAPARWCAPPSGSAIPTSPSDSWPVSSPAPPTPSTPSSRRTPPSPKPRGDLQAAADAYADAADRWERFGVVPEQAFALLGQGRCLLGSGSIRPRPHRSSTRPARSSSGSRRPPRSPRPTRSWRGQTFSSGDPQLRLPKAHAVDVVIRSAHVAGRQHQDRSRERRLSGRDPWSGNRHDG